MAIVISQDCDIDRKGPLTLCEIAKFKEVEGKYDPPPATGSRSRNWLDRFVRLITQHSRVNQKWFYLPPDPALGIPERMAVNYLVAMRIDGAELKDFCGELRIGRLKAVARAHFRERTAEFFRRYPVNDWYALDREEFEKYAEGLDDVKPYPWQK